MSDQNNETLNGIPILYLPLPNAFKPKKLSDHYSDKKVMRYREILILNKVSSKVDYSDYTLPSEDEIVKFIDSLISL